MVAVVSSLKIGEVMFIKKEGIRMAFQKPQVNKITADISNLSIYLRSVKKFGKTTLFRDVIMEKYGDPQKGLLVGVGGEVGYALLDNLNYTQVETYQDLVDLGNWLITQKGKEHNIEMIAFDTADELVLIADKETIARSNQESQKKCRSIKGAFGGFSAGSQYSANNIIKPYMSALKKAGFGIWVIAHTSMKTIKNKGDIDDDGYQMLTSNLEKNAESAFGDVFDITLTGVIDRSYNTKTKKGFNDKVVKENFVTEEVRKLYFRGTSVIDAGGRFADGAVPEFLVFDKRNMAKEFIKTIEEGIEKSKTDFSPANKKIKATEKVEIKADTDDPGEPVEGTMFDDMPSDPTVDLNELKKQIVDKCQELGGTKSEKVMSVVKTNGNPNALKTVEDAQKYLEALNK